MALCDASGTVGATAAAVAFPASGGTGPTLPTRFLLIANSHPSNTLGVNVSGGTASIGAAGTVTLNPGGFLVFDQDGKIPSAVSVIGSGAGTTFLCAYL